MSLTTLPTAFAAMGQYPQFIIYKLVPSVTKPGKTDKFPVDWRTGKLPAKGAGGDKIWTTFDNAAALAPSYGPDYGVGFSFAASDPFWFLDIDNCLVTPADGTAPHWSQLSNEICAALPGAAVEVSQSGRGLHLFGTGAVPNHDCRNTALGLEFYHEGRFVALTGIGAVGNCMTDHTAALPTIVDKYFKPDPSANATPADWTTGPCAEWRGPTDDAELIRRMLSSRSNPFGNRASVQDLWARNVEVLAHVYPSTTGDVFDGSSADAALAAHLSFWTGRDCERIARLMRLSGLRRDKYDRDDYLPRTISRVVAMGGDVYRERDLELLPEAAASCAAGPALVQGSTFANLDDQMQIFKGCVYVVSAHKVLVPGGHLVDSGRFNAMAPYNKYMYMLDAANEKMTRKAFEAFTQSQGLVWPQAQTTCFRPELPPGAIVGDMVNTWWPISTERAEGDVTPFLNHVKKMLPNEQDRAVLFNYMAALVQYPGDKFQWWPLIQSVKGNGKSLLLEVLEYCVGERYCFRPNAAEIAGGGGKFTGWLRGRVLVGFEEIRTTHKAEVLEILKPIVTNNRIEIQNKGVDQDMGDNRANGFLLTNYKDAVKVDDDERRYAPLFCAQQSKADLERDGMGGDYFPKLYGWLRQKGGLACLNHWLRAFVLDPALNPALQHGGTCHRAPITSSTPDAISATLGKVEQEVLEAIAECKKGFCGGWINSIELDSLLHDKRIDSLVPRVKRPEMLRTLGYVHHPELYGGRATAPTSDGRRPVLYVKLGHPISQITGGAAISKAYEAAQLQTVFGVDKKAEIA